MSILVTTLSFFTILLLFSPEGSAQIYKYVDKEGVIRFTDTPNDPAFKPQNDPQWTKKVPSPADPRSHEASVAEDKTTAQQKAISELQRQDKIRLATASDVASWKGEEEEKERLLSERKHGTVFVVLREITLPPGLYGAHRRDFIIPENVPKPFGDKGHCRFYYLKDNTFE